METKDYLEKYQKLIFRFFSKSLSDERMPHSIIFSGSQGTLLKESAIFIAKSFLCPNKSPFACSNCTSCNKIDKNESSHLFIYDTKQDTIKKADLNNMFEIFSFSSLDKKQKNYFYIINEAENLGDKILNSLLKVLEEPNSNVYAILTTHNEYKLLPTITSRCRIFKFKQIPRKEIIDECLSKNIDLLDAQLLSKFYNSADLIGEIMQQETYENSKQLFLTEIKAISQNVDKCFYESIKTFKSKSLNIKEMRVFLELLSCFFEEVCSYHYGKEIFLTSLKNEIEAASELPIKRLFKAIKIISDSNNRLDWNCNISLILDNLNYSLKVK